MRISKRASLHTSISLIKLGWQWERSHSMGFSCIVWICPCVPEVQEETTLLWLSPCWAGCIMWNWLVSEGLGVKWSLSFDSIWLLFAYKLNCFSNFVFIWCRKHYKILLTLWEISIEVLVMQVWTTLYYTKFWNTKHTTIVTDLCLTFQNKLKTPMSIRTFAGNIWVMILFVAGLLLESRLLTQSAVVYMVKRGACSVPSVPWRTQVRHLLGIWGMFNY